MDGYHKEPRGDSWVWVQDPFPVWSAVLTLVAIALAVLVLVR